MFENLRLIEKLKPLKEADSFECGPHIGVHRQSCLLETTYKQPKTPEKSRKRTSRGDSIVKALFCTSPEV